MILFAALLAVAFAIAGATAFVMFWPITLVHLRDRHAGVLAGFGSFAFASPTALGWLLSGRYRELSDRNLNGLATPSRLALMSIIGGLAAAGVLFAFGSLR